MANNDFNRSVHFSDEENTDQEPFSSSVTSQENQQQRPDQAHNTDGDKTDESVSPEKLLDAVKNESPYKCIRECFEKFFDNNSLRAFCYDYFQAVSKRLQDTDRFDEVIKYIVSYCEQYGKMEQLWLNIKTERSLHQHEYDVYYVRWKTANERSDKFKRVNTDEYAYIKQDTSSNTIYGAGSNPLDRKDEDLTQWFFGELKKNEQSLLLTAALFEGLSRRKMIDVAKTLEDMLSK